MSWMELRIISYISIRINKMHRGIVGFDDSKLRREEKLEALPREVMCVNVRSKPLLAVRYESQVYTTIWSE
jgi:hypothetical protein